VDRTTGRRVGREYVDSVTGAPVPREAQVKGYQTGPDDWVVLEEDEIAAVVPEADKVLEITCFIPCDGVDTVYFDKAYHLSPAGAGAGEPYRLLAEGMRAASVAALARTVLFRRLRTMLIRPSGAGLVGTTLNFEDEVRPAAEAFEDIADIAIEGEMLELARHIIATKAGDFDPAGFDDRYDAALAELVKAKIEGRAIRPRPAPRVSAKGDLLAALRESAGMGSPPPKPARAKPKPAPKKPAAQGPRRKAG
jgi:DNA end-binding protein Ku